MSPVGRAWLALAAIGAGLIHLALVVGAEPPLSLVLAAIGFVEFGWGVFVFAAPRLYAPRATIVAALVPTVLWVVAAAASLDLRPLPLLAATALEFALAAQIAVRLRRPSDAAAPGTARYVAGVAAGALVVAVVAGSAIALTDAPRHAVYPGRFEQHGH
jgi:hypothetical protein